jgi:hypothetical protein
MGDDHWWMYDGWKRNGAHTDEWQEKTSDFIECAFSLVTTEKIRCPCMHCQNARCFDKVILTKHLVHNGFTADYETWVFHGKKYTAVAAEESMNDRAGANRMDEMLDAIWPEFDLDTKDPHTPEVKEFFRLLKLRRSHYTNTRKWPSSLCDPGSFVAIKSKFFWILRSSSWLFDLDTEEFFMAVKSKFFSNNCYSELLKLIGDVLSNPNKLPKDMYHNNNLVKGLNMDYEKIDVCRNIFVLFWKEDKEENKCLKCGKPRHVEIINDDGETVTT